MSKTSNVLLLLICSRPEVERSRRWATKAAQLDRQQAAAYGWLMLVRER
jgi:hypothetical protein